VSRYCIYKVKPIAGRIGLALFPLDMLRYDSAWPYKTEDAVAIGSAVKQRPLPTCEITLCTHSQRPATDRWASFGWSVEVERKS
jgi:hypothetical protein